VTRKERLRNHTSHGPGEGKITQYSSLGAWLAIVVAFVPTPARGGWRVLRLRTTADGRLLQRRPTIPPLPEGEGRGEGERGAGLSGFAKTEVRPSSCLIKSMPRVGVESIQPEQKRGRPALPAASRSDDVQLGAVRPQRGVRHLGEIGC
jgi:hypothetical protein